MPGSAASKKSSRRKSRSGALAEASSIHTATRSANFTRGRQARSCGQDRIMRSARTTGTSSSECADAPKDKQVPRVGAARKGREKWISSSLGGQTFEVYRNGYSLIKNYRRSIASRIWRVSHTDDRMPGCCQRRAVTRSLLCIPTRRGRSSG